MLMQSALRLIYPSECLMCRSLTDSDFALCGPCWRETPFIAGTICDRCGVPLPGDESDEIAHCDECMTTERPWERGRAALRYADNGRKIVLGLKHGDRSDLVKPAAQWMARAAAPLVKENTVLVPVPLHWTRLFQRRYNQSAMLSNAVGKLLERQVCPDALIRHKRTPSLKGQTADQRYATLDNAIRPHPRNHARLAGKSVIVVDDVMTTGVTLAATCEAVHRCGAAAVSVLLLARTSKDT